VSSPQLKQSTCIITPVLKKLFLDKENLSNYRPISNLSTISKIVERVVQSRLTDHLVRNQLLNPFQSAYWKFHSTETLPLYADDSQLFISFQPTKFNENISCLQTAISAIADWMTSNLLCFNSAKTEFLVLGLKPRLNKIHNPALTLSNGASVCSPLSARNLGFIFDAHLNFSDQISLVHSKHDNCNSLYYGLPKTQLTRLQHIQNSLAHAVVAAPRSSDSDQILNSLHWLKVQERIEYKIISTTYTQYS